MTKSYPVKLMGVDCELHLNDNDATRLENGETLKIKLWDTPTLTLEDE